jgi:hypothetical protein
MPAPSGRTFGPDDRRFAVSHTGTDMSHVVRSVRRMGSNRRYPSHTVAGIDRHIEQVLTRAQPISLSEAELDKEHLKPVVPPAPIAVRAWVRYPETAILADGRAIAWTSKAVLVEWDISGGGVARAWVWASAVERKDASI